MRRAREGVAAYAAVTAAYWAFMLTDGALRMLVLLHFHALGFSPVQLAYLFVLYEVAGMATNLAAGWIAARFGLVSTLYAGMGVQVAALAGLAALDPGWTLWGSVAFVMAVQGASGVAKDLTKMSAKSAVKVLAPAEGGGLFRWVALLTGSKNAVKGAGFLLGAVLLGWIGFRPALWAMAGVLAAILAVVAASMPPGLPRGRRGARFAEVFSDDAAVNWLSAARLFLFGARDVWFVVGIPVFFHGVLSDGSEAGDRQAFFAVGGFMAGWIVFYGAVQAAAPRLTGAARLDLGAVTRRTARAAWGVAAIPALLAALALALPPGPVLVAAMVAGLLAFGAVFAVNSALHSYLILAYTRAERVTMDVGFYYMSNAAGRLAGTVLSGASYQLGGIAACLGTASAMAVASWLCARRIVVGPERAVG